MPVQPTRSTPLDRIFRRIDFEQLKLPLGFIRLVEAVFCLIIFAAFHGWRFDLTLNCTDQKTNTTVQQPPFESHSLAIHEYSIVRCNNTSTNPFDDSNIGSGADFYSYLIPFSLFLTVGMLLFYLFSYGVYASDDRIPIFDMTVTALLAALWMIGTLSFSISARRIEEVMTEEKVNKTLLTADICGAGYKCEWHSYSVYATLTIASLAGVGLFILFTSNIWYIYKETPYFRNRQSRRDLHHNNLAAAEPYTLE